MSKTMKDTLKQAQVTCIVIGAGQRGKMYSSYALDYPDKLKIVGVADPRKVTCHQLQKLHKIPDDRVYDDWTKITSQKKFADAVIIATPDQFHRPTGASSRCLDCKVEPNCCYSAKKIYLDMYKMDPAIACADAGYHILLEKPMATTEQGCRDVVDACKRNNTILSVCHVLRYYAPTKTVKDLIDSGAVGDVVNIQHREMVGFWHFAHAYVRGNWCCEKTSSFSLLAKCCHDVDLLLWWMSKYRCTKVSSFGSLSHFKKENQPTGASSRCLDCKVEPNCCYSAKKIYLDMYKMGNSGWPVSVICDVPSIESITEALQYGPYGRCVYDSDNDVCDNQVVSMEFSGGRTATLTMIPFSEELSLRVATIFGTKGEIDLSANGNVQVFDFLSQQRVDVDMKIPAVSICTSMKGHGMADFYIMDNFVQAVAMKDPAFVLSTPEEVLTSHLMAFTAEKARKESRVICFDN